MPAFRLGVPRPSAALLVSALVAVTVFWLAYDNGSYGLESRGTVAIVVWWALIVAFVFGLRPHESWTRASLLIVGLLSASALWTLASLLWSPSAENTFREFNRTTLYLGLFALATVGSPRRTLGRWADGLAMAISAVAVVALTSRLFPGSFPERDLPTFLPGSVTRLSFPLGYWNGLAIFLALGIPLLLRTAVVARSSVARALALAPLPPIAAVIYLASSRGGVVTALVGSATFLALTDRRWRAAAAFSVSAVGSVAAVAVLLDRNELVNGPLGTDLVEEQGRSAAVLIALTCLLTSAVYGGGSRLLSGRVSPSPAVGWAVVVLTGVVVAAGVAAADPVERYRLFKAAPGELETIERGDFVREHLLSGGGSGRWQNWSVALDQWRESPLRGEGAGSYESWWAEHRPLVLFVKDAHSFYLEALGELGVIGFGIVVALMAGGLGIGMQRALTATGDVRVTASALCAVFAGYAVAAGIDWVWELTAVSVLAWTALALLCGRATVAPEPLRDASDERPSRGLRGFGLGVAVLLGAWAVVVAQAIPLLAQGEIHESEAAVERGDLEDALTAAGAARDIQPWATTPYLQLALVSEEARQIRDARQWIDEAIARDERDWRLWLVSARLETKLGRVMSAEQSLRRAIALNPLSPLFRDLLPEGPAAEPGRRTAPTADP